MKLPAHRAGLPGHASGEQNVSKGNTGLIVLLDPPSMAGLAGHVPVRNLESLRRSAHFLGQILDAIISYYKIT
jgi:hypothetical protein